MDFNHYFSLKYFDPYDHYDACWFPLRPFPPKVTHLCDERFERLLDGPGAYLQVLGVPLDAQRPHGADHLGHPHH